MNLSPEVKNTIISCIEKGCVNATLINGDKRYISENFYRLSILRHSKTGKFLPRIGKYTPYPFWVNKYLKHHLIDNERLLEAYDDHPSFTYFDIYASSLKEAEEIGFWIVSLYRDTDRLLLNSDSHLFFENIPLDLKDIIDGAMAGDGCISQRSLTAAIFQYSISSKYIDHIEELCSELYRFGYRGKVRSYTYTSTLPDQTKTNVNVSSLTWTMSFLLNFYKRWYFNSNKKLPEDVSNSPNFWKWFYAGDGCLHILSPFSYRILISSNDFSAEEVDRLIKMLSDLDIKAVRYMKRVSKNSLHEQWILTINSAKDVDKFLSFVGDPVKGLEYKWKRPEKKKRICPCCQKTFIPSRGDNTICSQKCQSRIEYLRKIEKS